MKNTKGHTLLLINFGRGERISEQSQITQINNLHGSYKPKYPRAHDETLKGLVENLETHPQNFEDNRLFKQNNKENMQNQHFVLLFILFFCTIESLKEQLHFP